MSTEANTSTDVDYAKWIGGHWESKAAFERSVGAGDMGVSSPKVVEQKKSVERLHGLHASHQTRQRRLSINVEAVAARAGEP